MTRISIDHGFLSPSGKMSKSARKRELERIRQELFGEGLARPMCPQPTEITRLTREAANLRDLASRGMKPRAFIKQAEEIEKRIAKIKCA